MRSKELSNAMSRRTVLRGMLGGTAITVGLPFLECFLNSHGTALANGAPIPLRFGTWCWDLGMTRELFTPDKFGADFDLKEELAAIRPVKKHINLFSNYRTFTDGRSVAPHLGWLMIRCGEAPRDGKSAPCESLDVIVADAIGTGTRFPSLEVAATGDRRDTRSFRSAQALNASEISPVRFYERVFGPEFQDANSPHFRPNPELMLRKSVLSTVREDSAKLHKQLGSADRARLDEYFTSLRSLEQRLTLQLQRPAPAAACYKPSVPASEVPAGTESEVITERHKLMTDVLVAALACNQTRVFNMVYGGAHATKRGVPRTHHTLTHEESNNAQGYQAMHSWFIRQAMGAWAYFVGALASVREGDGTLLDNTLVFAHSDVESAKHHTEQGIPMMTAGRAGGRMKSGIHVDGRNEDAATQVGLTLFQAMGLEKPEWGSGSMRTSKVVDGILV